MTIKKEIKRGYVKWTDEEGVFHKEPLADHPELLAQATTIQAIAAEEARRLNEAAEVAEEDASTKEEALQEETLEALVSAPETVLTAADLTVVKDGEDSLIVPSEEIPPALPNDAELLATEEVPAPVEEVPFKPALWSEDHHEALEQLREETTK